MEVSDQLHTPTTLPQGKSPQYPLDRRPQSQFRHGDEEKNIPASAGNRTSVAQPVASVPITKRTQEQIHCHVSTYPLASPHIYYFSPLDF